MVERLSPKAWLETPKGEQFKAVLNSWIRKHSPKKPNISWENLPSQERSELVIRFINEMVRQSDLTIRDHTETDKA